MTIDKNNLPEFSEFEDLLVNNSKLAQLQSYLNRFNPIKIMKMERMEIRHSSVLGWLMDPNETHGFGDRFLKAFLAESFRGKVSENGNSKALEIIRSDFNNSIVRVEWQKIDILIYNKDLNRVFIIENKFGAKQSKGQLQTYRDRITKIYGKETVVDGVFLTLFDEEPEDKTYTTIGYENICDIIGDVLLGPNILASSEVRMFVTHYLDIIKEATGMSEDHKRMANLAKQLYLEHRKAIDFIVENGISTDFAVAARSIFGEEIEEGDIIKIGKSKYVFLWLGSDRLSFLPESWYKSVGEDGYYWAGCENWWSGYPIVCWFQMTTDANGKNGRLRLNGEVGPISSHNVRSELIEKIINLGKNKKLSIGFQKGAAEEGRRYSRFFKNNTEVIEDVSNNEQISEKMLSLLNKFSQEFEHVAPTLEFLLGTEVPYQE